MFKIQLFFSMVVEINGWLITYGLSGNSADILRSATVDLSFGSPGFCDNYCYTTTLIRNIVYSLQKKVNIHYTTSKIYYRSDLGIHVTENNVTKDLLLTFYYMHIKLILQFDI